MRDKWNFLAQSYPNATFTEWELDNSKKINENEPDNSKKYNKLWTTIFWLDKIAVMYIFLLKIKGGRAWSWAREVKV